VNERREEREERLKVGRRKAVKVEE
jgi:hypothetical protein